jgi:hypothetical protein
MEGVAKFVRSRKLQDSEESVGGSVGGNWGVVSVAGCNDKLLGQEEGGPSRATWWRAQIFIH